VADQKDAPPPAPGRIVVFTPVDPIVDAQTFEEFLYDRVPNIKCSICNTDKFSLLRYFSDNIPSVIAVVCMNNNEKNTNDFYATFGLQCDSCGNIQIFNSKAVAEWVKARAIASAREK
jgi:hypothetical protein